MNFAKFQEQLFLKEHLQWLPNDHTQLRGFAMMTYSKAVSWDCTRAIIIVKYFLKATDCNVDHDILSITFLFLT